MIRGDIAEVEAPEGIRIYDSVLSSILKARPLKGEAARVFLYLMTVVGKHNIVPTPTDTAKELELERSNVSRAYGQLLYDGYLVKENDSYVLHPFICYSSTEGSREHHITRLLIASVDRIAVEAEDILRKSQG